MTFARAARRTMMRMEEGKAITIREGNLTKYKKRMCLMRSRTRQCILQESSYISKMIDSLKIYA
jgi:hypothetical protein